jgi:hypothetical protein
MDHERAAEVERLDSVNVPLDMKLMYAAPAPAFSFDCRRNLALTTIYSSHYDRMRAVVAATRSGDPLLIKLALDFHDAHGCNNVDMSGKRIEPKDVTA